MNKRLRKKKAVSHIFLHFIFQDHRETHESVAKQVALTADFCNLSCGGKVHSFKAGYHVGELTLEYTRSHKDFYNECPIFLFILQERLKGIKGYAQVQYIHPVTYKKQTKTYRLSGTNLLERER